jgi:hypothetical protein
MDVRAEAHCVGGSCGVHITARHGQATAQGDERESAHPGASNAHQVNGSGIPVNEEVHRWAPI